MAKKKYTVKASTTAKRKPTRAQAVKASKTPVKADWASNGKKNKITKSFELGNFFLFELGKDFIGVSINNSYPDGKAWLGARTIKCADVDGLFAYLQKNLTDNATWNQIERTIANSEFEAKIDNMGGFVSDKDMNKPAKSVNSACSKKKSVKASDVDADRPNSAPNSWKSSQRMAYKVTEDQTKGERSFPTHIDDVYKVLGEMQGTWTNPTTGWTGDCEIYERDLDDGSYIFSLVFGGNELEPDDILYDPNGFNYYSNKPKFTIYPHSGAPTFADSLEDFKRKLKKEYSYLKKVSDDVGASMKKQPAKKSVKASSDCSDRREVINNAKRAAKLDGYNQDVYVDSNGEYGFVRHFDGNIPDWQDAQVIGQVKISWRGTIPSIEYVEMPANKKTIKASASAKKRTSMRDIKAGINAPSTDGPLCVCENCKAEIESREGRQTVYNVISEYDIEPDEKLICDWCEDEVTELYQISPDDVEGSKEAVKCSFDEGDPWEYQESYDYYYDEEPPAHIAKELERLAKLTDMYKDRWFEKFEELHPGERFSSVDPHPDVDEAVGYTLDEAEYSPDDIKAATSDDELEPIMGDDFAEDLGFGLDSNGDPIDESTVEELERIAQEIVYKSEIAKYDEYADVHNFDYYVSSPYVNEKFDLTFTPEFTSDQMWFNGFVSNNQSGWDTSATYKLYINVRIKSGEVADISLNDVDMRNSYAVDSALRNIDDVAIKNWVGKLVAPVAMQIYNATSNI